MQQFDFDHRVIMPGAQITQAPGLEAVAAYILDTYTGAAAAYSMRKLRTGQTNAIRLRRADNQEQDFGFAGLNLNTSAIAAWLGASTGYVVTWYDQSGNGEDLTHSTASKQPLYVASGQNSLPVMRTTDDIMHNTSISWNQTAQTVFMATTPDFSNSNSGGRLMTQSVGATDIPTGHYIPLLRRGNQVYVASYASSNYRADASNADDVPYLYTALHTGSVLDIYTNGTSSGLSFSHTLGAATFDSISIFGKIDDTPMYDGDTYELIIYLSDQSSNQTNIETDINNYWSIY